MDVTGSTRRLRIESRSAGVTWSLDARTIFLSRERPHNHGRGGSHFPPHIHGDAADSQSECHVALLVLGVMEPSPCEVKESRLGGKGTYATRNLVANTLLFHELAFLSAGEAPTSLEHQHHDHGHDRRPRRRSALGATPCLSTITVQHKHCPPCARLAPTDSGGSLSGSQDTYDFARAYSRSTVANRQRLLSLAAFGGDDTHAIVEVVQAEVGLLRSFDDELRAIPASELESAIHR